MLCHRFDVAVHDFRMRLAAYSVVEDGTDTWKRFCERKIATAQEHWPHAPLGGYHVYPSGSSMGNFVCTGLL